MIKICPLNGLNIVTNFSPHTKDEKDKENAFQMFVYFLQKATSAKEYESFVKQKLTTKDVLDAFFIPALRIA